MLRNWALKEKKSHGIICIFLIVTTLIKRGIVMICSICLLLIRILAMESSSSWVSSPSLDENSDEELLPGLPRHTKVTITGNSRTRKDLVGMEGVVTKAGGIGGWHWLLLSNGEKVKLQRNALTVSEPPTGNEEDDDIDDSASGSDTNHSTCKEVDIASNPTKEQLIKAAQEHFSSQKVDGDEEEQVITEFSNAAKRFQLEKDEEKGGE
ncbi:uncharacterized protein LOC121781793 isoform X2 [Salvia splendens]|uniref:uncharacterized protein LOC121781793 isoform X2 n=1 Tax=Salvia splendens TaxID=180675 RepID=UPI001C26516A|nr:uncharacterized protein LOC121781793 isoform X2 [Salvia splendens]